MSALKALGTGIGGIIAVVLLVLLVITLGSIVGGLVGALIATGYNVIFGASLPVMWYAAVGSIVAVVGGVAAAGSE